MNVLVTNWRASAASETLFTHVYESSRYIYLYTYVCFYYPYVCECFANEIQELRNGRHSILSGKVPVEVAVEVASSHLLFASFAFSRFSSNCILDCANYATNQHGTKQFWYIINKLIFVMGS